MIWSIILVAILVVVILNLAISVHAHKSTDPEHAPRLDNLLRDITDITLHVEAIDRSLRRRV